MKAAMLKRLAAPLVIEDVPEPVLGTGEVIVDVVATNVLAYAGDVLSGKRQYVFSLPFIPGAGCVGRVKAVGRDATQLKAGDWVLCDPTVRSRDNAAAPTIVLQGLTAGDTRGIELQKYVPDGSWAERVRVPTENAIALGDIASSQAASWATLGRYLVAYGGFDAVQLRAGEVVVVSGATGAFGSGGVAVALALGASCVIATGRSAAALEALQHRFGARVRTAQMSGDEERDRQRILDTAPGPIDCVLDLLPPTAAPAQVRAAVRTVRPYGRVVLMGGVREDLALPYAWLMRDCITVRGQWMYPRAVIARAIALVHAGLLSLDNQELTTFPLSKVNEAIEHAAAHAGPFRATLLAPGSV